MRYLIPILILVVVLFGCASGGSNDTATLEGTTYDLTTYEGLSAALENAGYTNVVNFGGVIDWGGELVKGMLPGSME